MNFSQKIRIIPALSILLALLTACSGGAVPTNAIPQTGATNPSVASPTSTLLVIQLTPTPSPATQIILDGTPATASPSQPAPSPSPVASCAAPASLTPAVTEGPYFKAGSPERSSFVDAGMPGTRLTITGTVFNASCQPVANAKLDFWQADAKGQYDNAGYTLRGHLFTDAAGRYQLETIIPGEYPGRTEHIHVKVQAPGGPVLTTQLFFPGVSDNQADGIFDAHLLLNHVQDAGNGKTATFDFVVGG
jgi:protocatechuate 3,4-dioxygenase beta subunit